MNEKMGVEEALIIAVKAHYGQKDRSGKPYIFHILRVMHKMTTDWSKMTALLHDVVEDTSVTLADLQANNCPTEVLEAVACLTLKKELGETYQSYFDRIKKNKLAMEVKLADMEDNLWIERLMLKTKEDVELANYYVKMYADLKQLLNQDKSDTPTITPAEKENELYISDLFLEQSQSNFDLKNGNKPTWANTKFLLQTRLLPLAFNRLKSQQSAWCKSLTQELEPWNERINGIQRQLKKSLVELLEKTAHLGVCPIKGTDALLWEMGDKQLLHTRDLDLYTPKHQLAAVEKIVAKLGYKQLAFIDNNSGKRKPASPDQIKKHQETTYETWPWIKFIHLPELEKWVDLNQAGSVRTNLPECALERVRYPLLVVKKKLYIGVEIDLHHGLWQEIPTQHLNFTLQKYNHLSINRMAIEHQLVINALKIAKELNEGKISALGSLWQLWHLMDAYGSPELYTKCDQFAAKCDIRGPWASALAFIKVILNDIMKDESTFPLIHNESTLTYAKNKLNASLFNPLYRNF